MSEYQQQVIEEMRPQNVLVLTPACKICGTPKGKPVKCEFLPNQRDGAKCEGFTQTKNPKRTCGFCAYYKTPKCSFASEQAYIKKVDVACADFCIDRHLIYSKQEKPKVVLRPHGKC